jgi:hypothetical protein
LGVNRRPLAAADVGTNFNLTYIMSSSFINILFIFVLGSASAFPRSTLNPQPSTIVGHPSTAYDELNRPAFYKAMEENSKMLVNAQLTELKLAPPNLKDAFLGTMIMKQAGLGGSPVTKLHLFKEGHKMLEAAIKQNPDNAEFRFLRLMIQENAPGFLGYKNNEQQDIEYIRKSYKTLPGEVQHAIADYNKKSKLLKLEVS